MTRELVLRAFFPFCGMGAGARGFLDASVELLGFRLRFEAVGGIDLDPEACRDFEYLTGAPAWCVDVSSVTPAELVRRFGASPDCVFLSPPCKAASGLTPKKLARTEPYLAMNELALVWIRTMLAAWPDDPPKLVLFENVPLLKSRAPEMLRAVRGLLRKAGYAIHEGYHDCGELGGLAQRRRRFLMVARLKWRCPELLYKPPKRRVRACGEVLGQLPVPATPEAGRFGKLHALPNITWRNWVRLALIPAGGDWRDLAGVLGTGEKRRKKFRRHRVESWQEPTGAVAGVGSNATSHVSDPRGAERFGHVDRVTSWEGPTGTITRSPAPSSGAPAVADPRVESHFRDTWGVQDWDDPAKAVRSQGRASTGPFSVADPRVGPTWFHGALGVQPWDEPSRAVIGGRANGASNVADPRVGPHAGAYGVAGWDDPSDTITGETGPSNGRFAVADPRLVGSENRHWNKWAVGDWDEPSRTVIGKSQPGSGGLAVADPRLEKPAYPAAYAVLRWDQIARTIAGKSAVGCGAYAVADPRPTVDVVGRVLAEVAGYPEMDPKKPPPFRPIIVSEDGTWHRPMTTLELACLQGLPAEHDGAPLRLAGDAVTRWRERIGNAVPVGTACAIAERMLVTLGACVLPVAAGGGEVWVTPPLELDGMLLEEAREEALEG